MDINNDLVQPENTLVGAIKQLAGQPAHGPALIVRTPDGRYVVSPSGSGEGRQNAYVISRSQLGALVSSDGLSPADLDDPQQAARIATLVAAFRPSDLRHRP